MTSPNEKELVEITGKKLDIPALKPPEKPIAGWRLWLPLVFQLALIVSVPAQAIYTHITGKTVILQTMPVDPYDLLRGYSQTLGYDISTQSTLERLPGWNDLPGEPAPCVTGKDCQNPLRKKNVNSGISFYVVLEAPKVERNLGRPQPWKPVRVSLERPTNLPENQVAIQGKYQGWRMDYGLETYYMPEDQREQVNADISQAQRGQQQAFVVEVKVDGNGKAVPVSLWVRDRNYRF